MQVAPRPVLTNVALQVPVLAADASSAQLEADLLKGNLQLTHTRLQLADLVSPPLHTNRERHWQLRAQGASLQWGKAVHMHTTVHVTPFSTY